MRPARLRGGTARCRDLRHWRPPRRRGASSIGHAGEAEARALKQDDESGLGDWVIRAYKDDNKDQQLGSGETTKAGETTTAADGSYRLDLKPGAYVICEVAQGTWDQTAPTGTACQSEEINGLADGGHPLTLAAGERRSGRHFGNRTIPTGSPPILEKFQADCTPAPCTTPSRSSMSVDLEDTIRYTLTIENVNGAPVPNVVLRDKIPNGLTLTDFSAGEGASCQQPDTNGNGRLDEAEKRDLRCVIASLGPRKKHDITVSTKVPRPAQCDIVGTSGDDPRSRLTDTDAGHTICGLGGSDRVAANGGNDTVYGDTPPGLVAPAPFINRAFLDRDDNGVADGEESTTTASVKLGDPKGDPNLDGGAGNDTLRGQAGDDTLAGALGRDTLDGEGGNDAALGGGGNDLVRGGAGNDDLNGDGGGAGCEQAQKGNICDDQIFGGDGRDRLARVMLVSIAWPAEAERTTTKPGMTAPTVSEAAKRTTCCLGRRR